MHSNVHFPFSSERVTQREKGGDQGRMEDEKNKDWPENDFQLEKVLGAFNSLSYPMERIVSFQRQQRDSIREKRECYSRSTR
jgi:hypothetical protein